MSTNVQIDFLKDAKTGNILLPITHLYAVRDSQGRTAEDILKAKIDPPTYSPGAFTAIADPTGNPSEQGWYEIVSEEYVPTEDTTVQSGKTYYKVKYYSMTL